MLSAGTGDRRGSARWPGHPPAAQHVGVDVEHRLPRFSTGIEDDTVAAAGGDPLGLSYLLYLERQLGQQAGIGARERGQVRVVILGDDQDMRGRLGIDVTKCEGTATFSHPLGRDVARDDLAEEAVSHGAIVDPTG